MPGSFILSDSDLLTQTDSKFTAPADGGNEVFLNIKDDVTFSSLGTPVFSDMLLRENQDDEGIYIDTLIITINQSKNIVKTPIEGRNGTIKEFISDGDYQITITGALVGADGQYPINQVNELLRICRVQNEINWISIKLNRNEVIEVIKLTCLFTIK